MINKVSIIKDAIRNEPHVLALATDSGISIKAVTEFGKSLVERVSFASDRLGAPLVVESNLPAGFEATAFKEISPAVKLIVEEAFGDELTKSIKRVDQLKISKKTFLARNNYVANRKSGFRAPSGRALNKFGSSNEKMNILDFKAKLFKTTTRKSEIVKTLEKNNIKFDFRTNTLVSRSENSISDFIKTKIIDHVGGGNLRRFFTPQEKINQVSASTGRAERRAAAIIASMAEEGVDNENKSVREKLASAIKAKLKR